MIKFKISLFTVLLSCTLLTLSQEDYQSQIMSKVREGLEYSLGLRKYNPKDIIIVQKLNSDSFYKVVGVQENTLETNKLNPPDIGDYEGTVSVIDKDSVVSVLWIKKKKYQSINIKKEEIPFRHLKSKFQNETFISIEAEINEIITQHQNEIYIKQLETKYPNIKTMKGENVADLINKAANDGTILSAPIIYPLEARHNNTQGVVVIGYVVTINGDIDMLHVFKGLKDGCTESVIEAIKNMAQQFKDNDVKVKEDIYLEATVHFILQ